MMLRGIFIGVIILFFICADNCRNAEAKPHLSFSDSVCAVAKKEAIRDANKGKYSVSISGMPAFLNPYAEIIFMQYYGKKVALPRYVASCIPMDKEQSDWNGCYSQYMDSVVQSFGPAVYQRVAIGADSLYRKDPYRFIEDNTDPPDFPGGNDAMHKILSENIHYPETAKRDSVRGTVYVKIYLDTTGKIMNTKIIKGVRHDLDSAALAGINSLPNFIPVSINGRKMGTTTILPVKFMLNSTGH